MKHSLLLILLFFHSFENNLFAQNRQIDSIQTVINISKEDSSKVNALNSLSYEYTVLGNNKKAAETANEALKLSTKINFLKGQANSYNNMAQIFYVQGEYSKALEYYFKGLKIAELSSDKIGIGTFLGNIGLVYDLQNDYEKALDYYSRALKIHQEMRYEEGVVRHLSNIANIYNAQEKYDKALEYYFTCIPLFEKQNNIRDKAIALGNIGVVYAKLKDQQKAIEYYTKAMEMREAIGDKRGVEINLGNIGESYILLNKYQEGEQYLLKALALAFEINDLEGVMLMNEALSDVYEKQNNWKASLEYYKKYTSFKDSLYNETKSKQIAEMQTKYELSEKEKELELSKSEQRITQYKNYIFIASFVFVALLSLLFLNRQLLKTKKQKDFFEIKGQLTAAELARNKLEKQNLETSLLLNKEKLEKITGLFREKSKLIDKMEVQLAEVKSKKNEAPELQQLLATIEEYIDPNQYWEEFITSFNLVHKNFFDQLAVQYPDLTRNELRLCALIKCNLGNKEIANVLNITPDSVKKSRTRLRKKLQLEVDENLTKFMLHLN